MSFTRRAARVEIILLKMFSYTVGEHRPEMAVLASLHVNLVAMYYCIFRFTYNIVFTTRMWFSNQ